MDVKTLVKKMQPIFAIMIMIMLIILISKLGEYNRLQKDINENCGWTDENYKCYCQYSEVMELSMENILYGDVDDVPLDG